MSVQTVPRCFLLRFRNGSRTFEDGYSIELRYRMPRDVFQQRMDRLNTATRAVIPTKFMVYSPFVSAFMAFVFYVIYGASTDPSERRDVIVPPYIVFAVMLTGTVATTVLSRIADVRLEKTIARTLNEYNQMDNLNGINWRMSKYDVQRGFNSDGRPIYTSRLMLELQLESALEPTVDFSYQNSTPERHKCEQLLIMEGGQFQRPNLERSVYGEPSTANMESSLPPPYKLADAT